MTGNALCRPGLLLLCLWLVLACLWGSSAADQAVFDGRSEVVVVEVPVNVSNREGESVRGLTAADFVVTDEGREQEVTDFEVIDLEDLEVEEAEAKRVREQLPSSARRHFLLLFDLSFSDPNRILRARQAAREWVLSSLHPTDLAAVMMYSLEVGPRLLVTFTPDRAQLARAIDTLGSPDLLATERRDPLQFVIDEPGGGEGASLLESLASGSSGAPGRELIESLRVVGLEIEKSQKAFERSRIGSWARSLGDVARILDSVKGRKHVVYFSEGFDGTLLFGRQPTIDDRQAQQEQIDRERGFLAFVDSDNVYGNSRLQGNVERMLEEFRRADCVIQAVDISGLSAGSSRQERNHQVGQDALFYMARGTGGDLYEDANNFGEHLNRVLGRSTVTYVLSFVPKKLQHDGAYHRLKVRLRKKGRGAQISHRAGYYAPRPFQDLDPLEKTLLASDAIASAVVRREIAIDLLAPVFRAAESLAYVPVILEIDGPSLLKGHEADRAEVEIYVYITDQRDEMKDFFTQRLTLDLAKGGELIAERGVKYYGHLDIAPGRYLVRVLVRNATTGRAGVVTTELQVPEYVEATPMLLSPFFIEPTGSWLLVREPQDQGSGGNVVYPFTIDGRPYVPAARPLIRSDEPWPLCLVAYNLWAGDFAVESRVVDAEGVPQMAGRIEGIKRTLTGLDGVDKLSATFWPGELGVGRYLLEIDLQNPHTGQSVSSAVAFEVVPGSGQESDSSGSGR